MNFIYLLLIFLLPTQFGKHFWPSFSFIAGFRVDYLSPTLYVTDLLILSLMSISIYRYFFLKQTIDDRKWKIGVEDRKSKVEKLRFSMLYFLLSFISVFIVGVFFAKNQPIALYGVIKLLEMVFFGWYTAINLGKNVSYISVGLAFASGILFESSLAIAQFFSHGSLGSIFYFFGERTFSAITPGIANASISGQLFLRPYGTLPHPNVLAGYLLIAMIFVSSLWQQYGQKQRWLAVFSLLLGSFALFLSLSRITIALFLFFLCIGVLFFLKKKEKRVIWVIGVMGAIGIMVGIHTIVGERLMSTSFLEESFLIRVDLMKNALWMIANYPLFGVGLMNFLVRLPAYQHSYSFYQYLQPVHNIFLLVFAELGILGGLGVIGGLGMTIRQVYRASPTPLRLAYFCMLFSILFLGMFDHYFITLQQGQLLFSFVLGLCYSLPQQKLKKKQISKPKRNFK